MILLSSHLSSQEMVDYTGQVFPLDHALNTRIDHLPVHPNSDNIVSNIGLDHNLHPDFGTQWEYDGKIYPIGISYNIVDSEQPKVPISFEYVDESDAGPWPIPENPLIETVLDWQDETDGDRHMLIIDKDAQILYESWYTFGFEDSAAWRAGSGAVFNLASNDLREEFWTSADAAGLPIFPLLIRYDEVERAVATGGEIPHAIRFTTSYTRKEFIWPARHYASDSTDLNLPPMGMRFRLKADFDISGFTPRVQVILRTLKKYGLILADNGSNWFIQGTHDDRWDDDEIGALKEIKGRNFEAVDIDSWVNHQDFNPNSAAVPPELASSISNVLENDNLIMLSQNYPNPVRGLSVIEYQIPGNSKVELSVYDILGNEMLNLVDEYQNTGKYSVELSSANLKSGIYVYVLKASGLKLSKRMVVIK
jgi:hypothetical protein